MTSNSQVHKGKAKAFEFFRPKPDGDIDPAGEAGWFLQRERERRGERLEQEVVPVGLIPIISTP